jgi:hypothetical protein
VEEALDAVNDLSKASESSDGISRPRQNKRLRKGTDGSQQSAKSSQ